MSASTDPTIQSILDTATQLTREQRELQIQLEIGRYSAEDEYKAVLGCAFGLTELSAISDEDFNHAALVSWKFIYALRQSRARTVH